MKELLLHGKYGFGNLGWGFHFTLYSPSVGNTLCAVKRRAALRTYFAVRAVSDDAVFVIDNILAGSEEHIQLEVHLSFVSDVKCRKGEVFK